MAQPPVVFTSPMISTRGLEAGYGKLVVLHDFDIDIRSGEFLGIIGHNGAGKSTLLNVLIGVHRPRTGTVTRHSVHDRRLRVAMVPQGLSVFPRMTVVENLEVPDVTRGRGAPDVPVRDVYELFPRLAERRRQAAGNLSGGEQRMLAIGMALRLAPDVLLLDEPSLGVAPTLVAALMEAVDSSRRALGYSLVMVEQNIELLLGNADRLIAIRQGRTVWEGRPEAISDARALWKYF